jgi:hypothetical protein
LSAALNKLLPPKMSEQPNLGGRSLMQLLTKISKEIILFEVKTLIGKDAT